jgi:nitroreductase/NAD-dependent dihydropyrimidine dehydrogenase PreA subunit
MNHVVVDQERCLHDGLCIASCPISVLERQTTLAGAVPTSSHGQRCIRCGHCVAVCHTGALALTFLPRSDLRPIAAAHGISPEQAEQLLQARRSIRRYRDKLVPREIIARALDSARFAPSGANLQPVAWTVLSGPAAVHKLAAGVLEWTRALVAQRDPLAQRFGFARFAVAWENGEDLILRHAPHVVLAHTSASDPMGPGAATIAVTYFQLAASALRLGTCWAGYLQIALGMSPDVVKLAGIPEGRQAHAATMLGYAKNEYAAIPPRKPLDVTWT